MAVNSFRLFVLAACLTAGYFYYSTDGTGRALRQAVPGGPLPSRCNTPNQVALTYDEGPHFDPVGKFSNTGRILDLAAQFKYKLTFHLSPNILATSVDAAAMAQRVASEGHLVGLRFRTDVTDLASITLPQFRQFLVEDAQIIRSKTGLNPKFLRLPAGAPQDYIDAARSLGFIPSSWAIDTVDYDPKVSVNDIVAKYASDMNLALSLRRGSIALNHDLYAVAANAATPVFDYLKNGSKAVVTMSECLGEKDDYNNNPVVTAPSPPSQIKGAAPDMLHVNMLVVMFSLFAALFALF